MAENDGSLSNGRNSIVKKQTVYELCFETCRHPPDIHLLADELNKRFFFKQLNYSQMVL
jgi:hypothetical protein